MDQLSEIGYHGTGVKKILDVMQVPKGSFYNYFASKEAFVADVVKEYGRELINELDESIGKSPLSAVNQLRIILDDSIENYESLGCRRGCLIGSLAAELGGHGIRVNALAPGTVATPGTAKVIDEDGWRSRASKTLIGELPTAQDIAKAGLFLVSDDARCITGVTLKVDSGMTIKGP